MFATSPAPPPQSHLNSALHRRGTGSSSNNSGSPPDLTNGSSPEDDSDIDSRSDQSGSKHPYVSPSAIENPWYMNPTVGSKDMVNAGAELPFNGLSANRNGDSNMVDGSTGVAVSYLPPSHTNIKREDAVLTAHPDAPTSLEQRTLQLGHTPRLAAGAGSRPANIEGNDEEMFQSLIKEDSFESAPTTTAASESDVRMGEEDAGSSTKRLPTKRKGPKPTQAQDELIGFSAFTVTKPPVAELPGQDVQAHVHGIPLVGAKSRVETQVRMRLELVRPTSGGSQSDAKWERIGSFTHIKLPPFTGSKRGSKKFCVANVDPEKTLFVDATVVRGSPPHERVVVCDSCKDRELRRAVRRKEARSSTRDAPSRDEMLALGIDPESPDAVERAVTAVEEREQERVVVFNCGDYVPFNSGEAILLTRITCYCRHHTEKLGFCIIFTLRDWQGRVVATGSTPPIMIMDDHKANAAAGPARKGKSKSISEDPAAPNGLISATDGPKLAKRERERSKPYDAPATGRQRRATNASATSAASTSLLRSPIRAPTSFSPVPALTPDHSFDLVPSPAGTDASSLHLGVSTPARDSTASMSLNHSTLQPDLQSAPEFDFDAFLRSTEDRIQTPQSDVHMLAGLAQNTSVGGPGGVSQALPVPPVTSPHMSNLAGQQPVVHKLIPGEGPTTGGIEVTVLGSGFVPGMRCVFGDVAAIETRVWADSTIVALLPPSPSPGPVVVTLKGVNGETLPALGLELDSNAMSPHFFTYVDRTDRALMELALQVVGLQMTGQMQSAREVAMRVVGSNSRGASAATSPAATGGASDSISGLFAAGVGSSNSFQASIISFIDLLDVDVIAAAGGQLPAGITPRTDSVKLANAQGQTLLHLAVQLGFHRLVTALIARGCPVDARDRNGYTALHFAALQGRLTIARQLIEAGARLHLRNGSGRTALELASQWEQIDVEHLLRTQMLLIAEVAEEDFLEDITDISDEWDSDAIESDVDDGNISTSASVNAEQGYDCDDEPEATCLIDGLSDISTKAEDAKTPDLKTPDLLSTWLARATAKPVDTVREEKAVEKEKGNALAEQAHALRNWFVRAGDTVKFPISRAGAGLGIGSDLGSLGMNMHMPAVPVFHLQLPSPPRFGQLLGRKDDSVSKSELLNDELPSNRGKGRATECESDASDSGAATPRPRRTSGNEQMKEYWKLIAICKNIVEESALWLNPLYQPLEASPPPPAYEPTLAQVHAAEGVEATASVDTMADGPIIVGGTSPRSMSPLPRARSRFASIAPPSRDLVSEPPSPELSPQELLSDWNSDQQDGEGGISEGGWPDEEDLSAGEDAVSIGLPSSSAIAMRRNATAVPSRLLAGPTSSPMCSTPTHVRGLRPVNVRTRSGDQTSLSDPMLVYFWLPALVVVLVLLLCSGQHSIFSLNDLLSYLPY